MNGSSQSISDNICGRITGTHRALSHIGLQSNRNLYVKCSALLRAPLSEENKRNRDMNFHGSLPKNGPVGSLHFEWRRLGAQNLGVAAL